MKILQTIPYFNKASGGPVSCTYQLVKGLNDIGVETDILSFLPAKGDVLAYDEFIKYLPDDRKTPLWLSRNMNERMDDSIDDYDIVHVNTIWTWPSHLPVGKSKKAGKLLVISPHGMLYPQALKVSGWKKKLISSLFLRKDIRKADCIHATSMEEAWHIRDFGVSNPIAVIPNCICVENYPEPRNKSNQKRRFGFVGRLNPIKNIDILIKAWISLGEKTNGCELEIIGGGEPEYEKYLKDIASSNKMHNISFLGFLSGNELHSAVRNLDYQILPSKSENFGMVVPEALICGVPVIASKGTPWEILEKEKCGWWVEPTVESIAEAIDQVIYIPEDARREMGDRGRQMVMDNFSSSAVALKMKHLYLWLLGKASKPNFIYED